MDKVIIDGVDVSGCKHYKIGTCVADYLLTDMNFSEAKCKLCPNCYYKQLQRAKAEIKELKKELEKHKSKIGHLLSPLTDSDFQDKLKKLERENERLKEQCDTLNRIAYENIEKYAKIKFVLQNIRNKLDFNKQELEECLHNPIDDEIREIINSAIGAEEW